MTYRSEPCDVRDCERIAEFVGNCRQHDPIVTCTDHLVAGLLEHERECNHGMHVLTVRQSPPCDADPCEYEMGNRTERCPFCAEDIMSTHPGLAVSIRSASPIRSDSDE